MEDVAFIGLGTMGLPMATNLLKEGRNVRGFDLSSDATGAFVSAGGVAGESIADTVADAGVVITMLPTTEIVKDTYLNAEGVLCHCRKDALLIDSSTIDVETARELNTAAAEAGNGMLDAPVSGAMAAAQQGSLVFMVGGSQDDFDRAQSVFAGMGRESIYIGSSGMGQATKICNNMLLGVHVAAASEALALGQALGLDLNLLAEVIGKSSGSSWVMSQYCPAPGVVPGAPSSNDYKPGFTNPLIAKDMGIFQQAALSATRPSPMASAALALYRTAIRNGHTQRDFSAMFEFLGGEI
ncbi:3-hydroxyisobutyrate dehydrogenase [Roseovarius sp. CAU 1744]|uniref:3-hydroxyisobutyrate dehydrogenase n=1 Tax=Roseovarius sp. CAU 1744 TaxID=3140368 RepID=UPI00325BA160